MSLLQRLKGLGIIYLDQADVAITKGDAVFDDGAGYILMLELRLQLRSEELLMYQVTTLLDQMGT